MLIDLLTYSGEKNRIDKSSFLTNRFTVQGTFRNNSSIYEPTVIVSRANLPQSQYNYMFIQDFGRYYFIDDIILTNTRLSEIHGKVDVLYTYATDILQSNCIIDKAEQLQYANLHFDDGDFKLDSRQFVTATSFDYGLTDNGELILICSGGVAS